MSEGNHNSSQLPDHQNNRAKYLSGDIIRRDNANNPLIIWEKTSNKL